MFPKEVIYVKWLGKYQQHVVLEFSKLVKYENVARSCKIQFCVKKRRYCKLPSSQYRLQMPSNVCVEDLVPNGGK